MDRGILKRDALEFQVPSSPWPPPGSRSTVSSQGWGPRREPQTSPDICPAQLEGHIHPLGLWAFLWADPKQDQRSVAC